MTRFGYIGRASLLLAAGAVIAAGCEQVKSENPLAPTVAGPMAGVEITAPTPVEPWTGKPVKDAEQPLVVVLNSAQSNSPRPFTMAFEIAADTQFSNVVYAQSGIKPAEDGGHVRLTLPSRLPAGRTYYWHMRADDGANTSGWSPATHFQILQPIIIGVPTPGFPVENERVATMTPQFRVVNGTSSGPHGALAYNFQISDTQTFGSLFTNAWVDQDPSGQTRYTMPPLPAPDRMFFWRVRISDGPNTGEWSRTETFRSPVASGPGPGGPGPSPIPGGGGPPSTCATNDGPTLVRCIESKYPEYLAAGVSHSQREANMAFLRDRIIESGRCGGMDLAWNRKRGNGPHSIDALAWRTGGRDEVVDIGQAFDDTSQTLRLAWGIVEGPPGYDGYPAFSCN
jgi:hypothetical protein